MPESPEVPLEDLVIGEDGVWKTDPDAGENVLHSLAALEEKEALHYLTRLQGKGQFQRALNAFSKACETPLYSAVMFNLPALTHAFMQCGADVNCLCRVGTQDVQHTPLHLAVDKGLEKLVAVLLDSDDIDINARRSPDDFTPLMVALKKHVKGDRKNDRSSVIQMLVADGAEFDCKDRCSGKTVLMVAVETKDVDVVRLILETAGVEDARRLINQHRTWSGQSTLHIAAGLRNVDKDTQKKILQLLIQYGGDTGVKNNEGDTPTHYNRALIEAAGKVPASSRPRHEERKAV